MIRNFDFCAKPLSNFNTLKIFERDVAKEQYLDRMSLEQNDKYVFSIYYFCEKLNVLIEEFNKSQHLRNRLVRFLSMNYISSIQNYSRKLAHNDYLSKLENHLVYLHDTLEISRPSYVTSPLDEKLEEIIKHLVEYKCDVPKALPARDFWNVKKLDFGYVLIDRHVNFYICDSISALHDCFLHINIYSKKSVLIICQDIAQEMVSDIFLQYLPLRIVTLTNENVKCYFDQRTAFRKIFHQLTAYCHTLLNDNNIHDAFRILITKLNEHLTYTLSRIEDHFSYNNKIEIKDRDFMLIVSRIKSFIYDMRHTQTGIHNSRVYQITCKLNALADGLSNFFEQSKMIIDLSNFIYTGAQRITCNADLYRLSGVRVANDKTSLFGENNLTAVLSTWLDGRFEGHKFQLQLEEQISNGRTDISIFYDKARIAIIESKLIQSHAPESVITNTINKGVYQLYEKYSSALSQHILFPPRLYLILFCFDPDYKIIRELLHNTLVAINQGSGILVTESAHMHTNWFRYSIVERNNNSFPAKEVHLDIMLTALRTKDNKDKQHGKYR